MPKTLSTAEIEAIRRRNMETRPGAPATTIAPVKVAPTLPDPEPSLPREVAVDDETGEEITIDQPLSHAMSVGGLVMIVPGHAYSEASWDNVWSRLVESGYIVVEPHTVGEILRMASALQPDAIFLDACPVIGWTKERTVDLIKKLDEAAPVSGIAVIAAEWLSQDKDYEKAMVKADTVFFGYPTDGHGTEWIARACTHRGRINFSREKAQRLGIELH